MNSAEGIGGEIYYCLLAGLLNLVTNAGDEDPLVRTDALEI